MSERREVADIPTSRRVLRVVSFLYDPDLLHGLRSYAQLGHLANLFLRDVGRKSNDGETVGIPLDWCGGGLGGLDGRLAEVVDWFKLAHLRRERDEALGVLRILEVDAGVAMVVQVSSAIVGMERLP